MVLVFSAWATSLSTKAGDPDMAVALCVLSVCRSLAGLQSLMEQKMVIAPTFVGGGGGREVKQLI